MKYIITITAAPAYDYMNGCQPAAHVIDTFKADSLELALQQATNYGSLAAYFGEKYGLPEVHGIVTDESGVELSDDDRTGRGFLTPNTESWDEYAAAIKKAAEKAA